MTKHTECFVSLMHGNNELGNVNPLEEIAFLCKRFDAFFHSDTVQTIGHRKFILTEVTVDSMVGSAHKFHGPKGIGLMFVKKEKRFSPLLMSGSQEKDFRAGTENVAGIIGFTRSLQLTYENLELEENELKSLKNYLLTEIKIVLTLFLLMGLKIHL